MRICCKGTQNAFESAEMALWFALFGSERPRKNQSERSRKNLQDLKVNVSDTYLAWGFGMLVDLRTCHWCFSSFFILPLHSSCHQPRNFPFCSISGWSKLVTSNLACCSAEKKCGRQEELLQIAIQLLFITLALASIYPTALLKG